MNDFFCELYESGWILQSEECSFWSGLSKTIIPVNCKHHYRYHYRSACFRLDKTSAKDIYILRNCVMCNAQNTLRNSPNSPTPAMPRGLTKNRPHTHGQLITTAHARLSVTNGQRSLTVINGLHGAILPHAMHDYRIK